MMYISRVRLNIGIRRNPSYECIGPIFVERYPNDVVSSVEPSPRRGEGACRPVSLWRRDVRFEKKTEENIRDLKTITIALIEKSTALQGDLIRLDTMLRVKYGLPPDEVRIGRDLGNAKRERDKP